MHIKLDIDINLLDLELSGNGILNGDTIKSVYIKFNDIDDRFQIFNCTVNQQLFIDTNGMHIMCSNDAPMGRLNHNSIILPYKNKVGKEVSLNFFDDECRKDYLKRLYNSLLNWSNNWWGFDNDSSSKISVIDNKWVIYCEHKDIYKYETMY